MTTIQIRIDEKTKKEAMKIFNNMGIDMSTAIKIYLKKVIAKQGIPFDMTIATDSEIQNIHNLSKTSLDFWNNSKDDVYDEFYNQKKNENQTGSGHFQ